jgi:hypothetical protein
MSTADLPADAGSTEPASDEIGHSADRLLHLLFDSARTRPGM